MRRGVDTVKLFLWLEQLRSQARAAGGDVISHLGNHEWMNLLGLSSLFLIPASSIILIKDVPVNS